MITNISSGGEYANYLVKSILETEKALPVEDRIPCNLMEFWIEELIELAEDSYIDYIIGKKESYLVNIDEIEKTFKVANQKFVDFTLQEMLDKDLLSLNIDKEGNLVYKATEKGRKLISK